MAELVTPSSVEGYYAIARRAMNLLPHNRTASLAFYEHLSNFTTSPNAVTILNGIIKSPQHSSLLVEGMAGVVNRLAYTQSLVLKNLGGIPNGVFTTPEDVVAQLRKSTNITTAEEVREIRRLAFSKTGLERPITKGLIWDLLLRASESDYLF